MNLLETVHLSDDQIGHLDSLASSFPEKFQSGEEAAAMNWVDEQIEELRPLFAPLVTKVKNTHAAVIKGLELPILPPTPDRYLPVDKADVHQFDVPHLCIAALTGAAYGTAHVRGGRIIADIIPRPGFEQKPDSAFGSKELFDFHADGVLQPDTMPDYFSLHCLRNKLRTPTLVSHVDAASLSHKDFELLQQPVFTLRYSGPQDTTHIRTETPIIETMSDGNLQYNYYGSAKASYDHADANKVAYTNALEHFHEALNQNVVPLVLEAGDIAIVNNRSALHGRAAFDTTNTPVAEGRWLRRVHIATTPPVATQVRSTPNRVLHSAYMQ